MTSGSAEKLDFTELMSQFSSAKVHFVNSQREVLLGFREMCRIIIEVSEHSKLKAAGELPLFVVRAMAAVLDYFIARVPEHGQPTDILAAKIQAIDEIIAILDDEAVRVGSEAKSETDLAKVEALQSIKKYLLTEKEQAHQEQEAGQENKRIRKVDIE